MGSIRVNRTCLRMGSIKGIIQINMQITRTTPNMDFRDMKSVLARQKVCNGGYPSSPHSLTGQTGQTVELLAIIIMKYWEMSPD